MKGELDGTKLWTPFISTSELGEPWLISRARYPLVLMLLIATLIARVMQPLDRHNSGVWSTPRLGGLSDSVCGEAGEPNLQCPDCACCDGDARLFATWKNLIMFGKGDNCTQYSP